MEARESGVTQRLNSAGKSRPWDLRHDARGVGLIRSRLNRAL